MIGPREIDRILGHPDGFGRPSEACRAVDAPGPDGFEPPSEARRRACPAVDAPGPDGFGPPSEARRRACPAVDAPGPDGPTLVFIAGIHGNEAAGVLAVGEVLARLRREGVRVCGEIAALRGNVRALAKKQRYLARDLNRSWTEDSIAAARASEDRQDETAELFELSTALDAIFARARGPIFAIDLHTTSADGIPFAVVGESEAHRDLARRFPLPGIVGLEERLEGTLTRHLGQRGVVTLAVEGGQHESPATRTHLEAVVTIALSAAGVVDAADLPELDRAIAHLASARGDLPQLIEVVSRHAVEPAHAFRMEPGFANIQRTKGGTLLAKDLRGEIRAPFDGLVLLPLYQPQGNDGFFYCRPVES